MQNKDDKQDKDHKYIYFVDGDKFEIETPNTTGALIKVKLPESKRGYALYLEGHGNDADILINDDASVSLEQGAKHFYTVPPLVLVLYESIGTAVFPFKRLLSSRNLTTAERWI